MTKPSLLLLLFTFSVLSTFGQVETLNTKWLNVSQPSTQSTDSIDFSKTVETGYDNSGWEEVSNRLEDISELIEEGEYRTAVNRSNVLIESIYDGGFCHYLRGIAYAGLRKYDSALYDLKLVLKTKEYDLHGYTRIQMGEIWMNRGDHNQAITELEYAKELLPDDPTPAYSLANIYLERSRIGKAKQMLDEAIEIDSTYFDAYALKSIVYLYNGRRNAAIKEIDELLSNQPDSYSGNLIRGFYCVLENEEETHRCNSYFEKTIELEPELASGYWFNSMLQLENNNYKEGIKNMTTAWKIKTEGNVVGEGGKKAAELHYTKALDYFNSHIEEINYAEMVKTATAIYEFEGEEYYDAINEMQAVAKRFPESKSAQYILGSMCDLRSRSYEAIKHYFKVFERDSADIDLLHRIGKLEYTNKNYENAISHLRHVLRNDKENYYAMRVVGDSYFESDNPLKSIGIYTAYLHYNGLDYEVMFRRGKMYERIQVYDKCMQDYESAIEIDTVKVDAYEALTMIHYAHKDTISAIETIDRFILANADEGGDLVINVDGNEEVTFTKGENGKSLAIMYNLRGALKSFQQDHKGALDDFYASIKLYSLNEAQLNAGQMLYQLERYRDTIAHFEKFLDNKGWVTTSDAIAYYYIGLSWMELGEKTKALKSLKTGAKKNNQECVTYLEKMQ